MLDQEFRFKRHLKLWEEQNRLVKRVIIGAALFATLLTVKVLVPFSRNLDRRRDVQAHIVALTAESEKGKSLQATLRRLEEARVEVQSVIQDGPWFAEKDELIRRLRSIREQSPNGGTRQQFQDAADETIRNIGSLIVEKVLRPLERTLAENYRGQDALEELAQSLEAFRSNVKQWEDEHVDKNWYNTFEEKDQTMIELTNSLMEKTDQLNRLVDEASDKIEDERRALEANISRVESEISAFEKDKERLREEMQGLLPKWSQGVLDVDHMVQLFPLILVFVAGYVVVVAVMLTRHYEFVATSVNLSDVERKDLATSSLWTLTRRGRIGTALTLGAYIVVVGTAWILFEWGYVLLVKWLQFPSPNAWIKGDFLVNGLRWGCRLMLALMILLVLLRIYTGERKRARP